MLETERLRLIPVSLETLELLDAQQYARAGAALGVTIPDGWPHEPEAIDGIPWHLGALRADPSAFVWRVRLIVFRAENCVIGSINMKGPPDVDGMVEIGWGVRAAYRMRGIATEATRCVLAWAIEQPQVQGVIATIPAENQGSKRVAARVGMVPTEEIRRGLPVWELHRAYAKDGILGGRRTTEFSEAAPTTQGMMKNSLRGLRWNELLGCCFRHTLLGYTR